MPATEQDLLTRLDALGIEHTTHRHPAVFTVEEARAHCSHLPGCHCKNLFLKDKKGLLWLVVARADAPIAMKQLDKQIGSARLSFGKPDLLMEVLGVIPGAVTPFALINDKQQRVNVVLDEAMMASDLVNYHPLTNEATTALTPDTLLAFIRACGHEPAIVRVDAMPEI
ncbi:MAG: prolyl-tRNA synthetase associated domain-containing protein [Alphaproteobacteria bacterium]|jgi:Ala-tRNA(Pro) deacylase|nr:prolyl-tRNA synthetase associated domain-containing protein [Rhodospirillaceae bacterium]MDG2483013.1 prolyl-tRNA synthetase associated domain-containing protein [Alphaproteobacteria bacterium]MBT6205960.1 prolyl-tRNA synthetase associated domain-containing protein [Rhodospirillaceae bacterium]MBT6510260.1 prolyl-tRNA synthetase associated domain-containing protein [Rhodospirillaceae bacterium]MBT7612068.1 prolyl-tRNA synthetase associated domain-containing protein [Rhodospirillaceae bacteri